MNYLYAKYKYSDKIKLLRMLSVIVISAVFIIVGFGKVFDESKKISSSFGLFAVIVMIVCCALIVVVGFLGIYKQTDLGKIYPVIAITLGLIFVFLIPAFETPDEQDHFGSAYNQSNVYLDYGNPYEDGNAPDGFASYRYMRRADVTALDINLNERINSNAYNSVLDNLRVIDESERERVVAINHFANNNMALYYLPALGITLARLLNLGFGFEYVFGALLNMLFYVLMTTYAINTIPVGKRVLFVVSLLPITLQQASSFSYDCGVIACIMVVVAQAFRLKAGDKIHRNNRRFDIEIPIIRITILELVMYIVCAYFLSSVKSGVFLIVLLLPIVLCINKNWFKKSAKKVSIPIIVLLFVGILAVMYMGGYHAIYTFLVTTPVNVREIYGQMGVAPIEYIRNPMHFLSLVFNTLAENTGHYFAQIGGTALGYSRIFIFKGVYIINLAILLLSMVRYKKECDEFAVGNRIMAFIVGLMPILITACAMLLYWTLPTDNVIMGFQGRYIIPTLPILMLSAGRWRLFKIPDIDNLFAIGMTITGSITCISVLSYI